MLRSLLSLHTVRSSPTPMGQGCRGVERAEAGRARSRPASRGQARSAAKSCWADASREASEAQPARFVWSSRVRYCVSSGGDGGRCSITKTVSMAPRRRHSWTRCGRLVAQPLRQSPSGNALIQRFVLRTL